MITFRPSAKFDQPTVVIFFDNEQFKRQSVSHLRQAALVKQLAALRRNGPFQADAGEIFPLILEKRLFLLAGLGDKNELTATGFRNLVRSALTSSYIKTGSGVEVIPNEQKDPAVRAVIDGITIGTYVWKKYRGASGAKKAERRHYLVAMERKEYKDCVTVSGGITLARDLVNENADVATSVFFEKTIRGLVKGRKGVKLEILNRKELKAKGLGLHLAVNQGSNKEPKLIIVKYNGGSSREPYVALIGKGMTYDTGGLNLKPTGHIETMRCDMSGAAAVVGTLKNTLALNLRRNVIFAVGLAENAIDANAYKPGDVFKSYNGMHVEIGNTDAEGRLVLADAISYVVRNYKPGRIIDIATLTGACVVALGFDYTGLVTTSDDFARDLVRCSNDTDDRVWRLPMYPELKEAVRSEIADIRNMGFPRGAGGTITAAEFLRQFTNGTPWAHLDIAGTAFMEGKGRNYYSYGGTGAGVRLMTEFLKRK